MALYVKKDPTRSAGIQWSKVKGIFVKTNPTRSSGIRWAPVKKAFVKVSSSTWKIFFTSTVPEIDTPVSLSPSSATFNGITGPEFTGTNHIWTNGDTQTYYFRISSTSGGGGTEVKSGSIINSATATYTPTISQMTSDTMYIQFSVKAVSASYDTETISYSTVSSVSKQKLVTPQFSTPTKTSGGFTATISNYLSFPSGTTFVLGTPTAGSASISTNTITVTGLTAGQSSSLSVYATNSPNYRNSDSATLSGSSLGSYSVTYAGGSHFVGGSTTDTSSPYAEGSTVTVKANGFTAENHYAFLFWTDQDGNQKAPGDTFIITKDMTLTAQWTQNSTYTVTYYQGNATSGTPPTDPNSPYFVGDPVTTMTNSGNLAKTGYYFTGWAESQNGSLAYAAGASITGGMPAKNLTLYPYLQLAVQNVSPPTISPTGAVYINDTLTATPGTWNPSTGITISGQWQSYGGGGIWGNANGSPNTNTTYTIIGADTGTNIRYQETASPGGVTAVSTSDTAYVTGTTSITAGTGGNYTFSNTHSSNINAYYWAVTSSSGTTNDFLNGSTSTSFNWSGGTIYSSGSGSSVTVSSSGRYVHVIALVLDATGKYYKSLQATYGPTTLPKPGNLTAPVLSGVNTALTVTSGTWDVTPTQYTYQWLNADTVQQVRSFTTTSTTDTYTGTGGVSYVVNVTAWNGTVTSDPASSNTWLVSAVTPPIINVTPPPTVTPPIISVTPPIINVTPPPALTVTAKSTASGSLTITWNAITGTEYYDVLIDGFGYSAVTSPYTVTGLSTGSHTITVNAYSKTGNLIQTATITYSANGQDGVTPPIINVTPPPTVTPPIINVTPPPKVTPPIINVTPPPKVTPPIINVTPPPIINVTPPPACVTGDTLIRTLNGYVKAKDLYVGQMLKSYTFKELPQHAKDYDVELWNSNSLTNGSLVNADVLAIKTRRVAVTVIFNNSKTGRFSLEHMLLTRRGEIYMFVQAGVVRKGDYLVNDINDKNTDVLVESLEYINENIDVYELTVSPYHLFIAGDIIAHNKKGLFQGPTNRDYTVA